MVCVAVHGGAGIHSRSFDGDTRRVLHLACKSALKEAMQSNSLELVQTGISLLEDSTRFNAGYGSNLTLSGTVECDASIMDGSTGNFGSAGAVVGVKNPIKLAHGILKHQRINDTLGRIPPMTLVGEGARSFAASHGLDIVSPVDLISPSAREDWRKWKDQLTSLTLSTSVLQDPSSLGKLQDTVGAVVLDSAGNLASGVSSGGLLLKHPGRIGEAAVFGAGCWAQQWRTHGMACSLSGTGEYIMRAMLARSIGEALKDGDTDTHDALERVILDEFWKPCQDRGESEPNVGVLLLIRNQDDTASTHVRLWCAFTTESMAIAFASSNHPTPQVHILRRVKGGYRSAISRSPLSITAFSLKV